MRCTQMEHESNPGFPATNPGFGHIELDLGGEADLSADDTRAAVGDPRVAAMRELYAEGDANGALFIGLSIAPPPMPDDDVCGVAEALGLDTIDDPTLDHLPSQALETVGWERIPHVLVPRDRISELPIDHRTGFLLAHVDGTHTLEEIIDVCAMPQEEAILLLRQLIALNAIAFRPPTTRPPSRRPR
jgi:hypothetical protein